jgi:hypothetical protein
VSCVYVYVYACALRAFTMKSRSNTYNSGVTLKAAFQGTLLYLDKGNWREVKASFVPAQNKLLLDGLASISLKDIETCRHDTQAPPGLEDYGFTVMLTDGRRFHLATSR